MTTSPETSAASDPDAGVRVAALYEAHGRTILGLCRFLLRDVTEAEDAAQQSFLSAYRSLLGGAVPREPAAWLAAIARNECWLRIKRRMREPLALELEVQDVPSTDPDPLEAAARNADFAALRAGLESLSRPQREAFMLREFAGLSYGELALTLGVTEPAVDSLLFRARTGLRRALQAVNGLLVPVALREQLARLIPGFDQPAAGTLAKLASLPIAAKLAAAGGGAVLVVAGSVGLDRDAPPAGNDAAPTTVSRTTPQRVAVQPLRSVAVRPRAARPMQASASERPEVRVSQSVAPAVPSSAVPTAVPSVSPSPKTGNPPPADPGEVPTADPPTAGDGGGVTTFAGGAPPPEAAPDPTPTDAPAAAPTEPERNDVAPTEVAGDSSGRGSAGSDGSGSDGSGSDGSGSDGSGSDGSSDGSGSASGSGSGG